MKLFTEPRIHGKVTYIETHLRSQLAQDVDQYISSLAGRNLVTGLFQIFMNLILKLALDSVHGVDTSFNQTPLH
jgi:hypothetical protein